MSIRKTMSVVFFLRWSDSLVAYNIVQYIVLHRVQPITQKGYLLVAHTAFSKGWKGRGNSTWYLCCRCLVF